MRTAPLLALAAILLLAGCMASAVRPTVPVDPLSTAPDPRIRPLSEELQ